MKWIIFALFMHWNLPDGEFAFEVEGSEAGFSVSYEGETFYYPSKISSPESDYYIEEPRKFEVQAAVQSMTLEELARLIKTRRVIFYTGAGISAAAGIPMMKGLKALFALEKPRDEWAMWLKNHPEEVVEKARWFDRLCHESKPTKAHLALKKICSRKKIPLWTENLDHLHQKSGMTPLVVSTPLLREKIAEETLKSIEAIICVGMSADDKGVLNWYKKHNPLGKIIAIDLSVPHYLGEGDLLIQGDLQEILPQIERRLSKKSFQFVKKGTLAWGIVAPFHFGKLAQKLFLRVRKTNRGLDRDMNE